MQNHLRTALKSKQATESQRKEWTVLYKATKKAIKKAEKTKFALAEWEIPLEDDWKYILDSSTLSDKIKNKIQKLIAEKKPTEEESVRLVKDITTFFKFRYSNYQKYNDKVEQELQLTDEEYYSYLEKAIIYSIEKKGVELTRSDLSAHFIMLLKGIIKPTELESSAVKVNNIENGVKINFSRQLKETPLPKLTTKLNKLLPPKLPVALEGVNLSVVLEGGINFNQNSTVEIKGTAFDGWLEGVGSMLIKDVGLALDKFDFGANLAGGEIGTGLNLGFLGTPVGSIKIADLSLSLKEGTDFKAFQGTLKWEKEVSKDLGWFEGMPHFADMVNATISVAVSIDSSLALKPTIKPSDVIPDKAKKAFDALQAERDKIYKEGEKLLKKNAELEDLVKKKEELLKRQKLNKQLDNAVRKARGKKGQIKLLRQRGQNLKKLLEAEDAYRTTRNALGETIDLDKELRKNRQKLLEAVKKTTAQAKKLEDFMLKKSKKLLWEVMEKQAAKLVASLVMKFIPGLNVISIGMDIYDGYVLYCDIRDAYSEANQEVINDTVEEQQEIWKNEKVSIQDVPFIVVEFMHSIGAGGRLDEITQEEIDALQSFFNQRYPEGSESQAFMDFIFEYSEWYDIHKGNIEDNKDLLKSMDKLQVKLYDGLVTEAAQVVEAIDFDEEHANGTNFFKTAHYSIVSGDITQLNTIIEVDGMGADKTVQGNEYQVTLPNDKFIKLRVVKFPDSETINLELEEDYVIAVEKYDGNGQKVKTKKYKMTKGARFTYNKNKRKLLRK